MTSDSGEWHEDCSRMQNLFIKSESKKQVESAIRKADLSSGTKLFLQIIAERRFAKNNYLVFFKIKNVAAELEKSPRQVKRYIAEAEEAGYLIVEDQVFIKDEKAHRINGRYWLTTGLMDAADLGKVRAIPPRPSKVVIKNASSRPFSIIDLNKRKKSESCHGGGDIYVPTKLLLSKLNNNLTTRQTSPNGPPKGGIRGVGGLSIPVPKGMAQISISEVSKPEPRAMEAKEILKAYTSHFGPPGQRTRDAFINEYILGNHNKQDLLAGLDLIASTEGLRSTTTSPNRLFYTKIAVSIAKKGSKPFKFQHEESTDWFGGLVNMTL